MSNHTDPDATVRHLLAAAGLGPSDEEVAVLAAAYGEHRAAIDALYVIPEVRYASPALIFDPTPTFADWSVPPPDPG
jgi:hypothetical protein